MTKEEKRKNGIIKVFNFDEECKHRHRRLEGFFTKRIDGKDYQICEKCNKPKGYLKYKIGDVTSLDKFPCSTHLMETYQVLPNGKEKCIWSGTDTKVWNLYWKSNMEEWDTGGREEVLSFIEEFDPEFYEQNITPILEGVNS